MNRQEMNYQTLLRMLRTMPPCPVLMDWSSEAIEELLEQLRRADPLCENMHHDITEQHKHGEPCPVESWVRRGI